MLGLGVIEEGNSSWNSPVTLVWNGLHESIGMEPYYAMFGTRMVTDGTAYPILRKLGGIQAGDPQISLPDKMELIR